MLLRTVLCISLFVASTAAAQDSRGKAGVEAGPGTAQFDATARFASIAAAGLLVSSGTVLLSLIALPESLALLPLSPLATAGVATFVGDRMDGQGRFGLTLLGSVGGGLAGAALGFGIAFVSTRNTPDTDDGFADALPAFLGAGIGFTLGLPLGSALGYTLSDARERKNRKHGMVSAGVVPLAHGMVASLAGRF